MGQLLGLNEFVNKLNEEDCTIGNTNKTTLELASYVVDGIFNGYDTRDPVEPLDRVMFRVSETLNTFNGKVMYSKKQAMVIAEAIVDVCFKSERSYVRVWEVVAAAVKFAAVELAAESEDFEMCEGMYMEVIDAIGETVKANKDVPYSASAVLKVSTALALLTSESPTIVDRIEEWSFSGATSAKIRNLKMLVNKLQSVSHRVVEARTLKLNSQLSRDILLKLIFNEEMAEQVEAYYGK